MTKTQRLFHKFDRERGFRLGWNSAMTARSTNTPEVRLVPMWGKQFKTGFVEGRDAGRIAVLGEQCPIAAPPG